MIYTKEDVKRECSLGKSVKNRKTFIDVKFVERRNKKMVIFELFQDSG